MNTLMKFNQATRLTVCLTTLFVAGCSGSERPPIEKNIAWCVNICTEDIFEDMHSNGESWGTGSSSLTGMAQKNTLLETRKYCESIYEFGCYSVRYGSRLSIHNKSIWSTANESN